MKQYLIEKNILNYGETEFYQGHTMRWGLCWSFDQTIHFGNIKVLADFFLKRRRKKEKLIICSSNSFI